MQLLENINKLDSANVKQKLNLPISIAELRNSISKLNKSSCGGPDGISSKLLECFSKICPNLILKAINEEMFSGNSNGKAVNKRTIIFIPKPTDRLDIKKIRPISLLNTLYRVADICLTQRLNYVLESSNIFSHNTYAYRKSFSIPDAILTLCTTIENIKLSNTKVCIIQTDIEAGFDSVSRSLIKKVLEKIGLPIPMIEKIFNLGKHAIAKLAVNLECLTNRSFKVSSGTAQGQASSVTLFNIAFYLFYLYINSEPELFNTYKIILDTVDPVTGLFNESEVRSKLDMDTSISFSDDGLILAIYQGTHSITNILDLFKKFSTFSGLRISPAKSKIIPINFAFSKTDTETLEN